MTEASQPKPAPRSTSLLFSTQVSSWLISCSSYVPAHCCLLTAHPLYLFHYASIELALLQLCANSLLPCVGHTP